MNPDLGTAFRALQGKQALYNRLWAYYDGEQPLVYSSRRLRELFRSIDARFSENWCEVVVSSAAERIRLQRFEVAGRAEATRRLESVWERLLLGLEADDAHEAALVCGEAFVIAWRNEEEGVEAHFNDPRLCHVLYRADRPNVKRCAAKWWVDEAQRLRMTLYYADRLEYYASDKRAANVRSAKDLLPDPERPSAANPFGEVPMFHVRRDRRRAKSELTNVIPIQDAVNKELADLMVASEFASIPQRYVISNAENLGRLQNAPNKIWSLPAAADGEQGTAVGQFEAADLSNFLKVIDHLVSSLAVISRTPKHYFLRQGGDPSGEALVAMEAPLNKKCARAIERFKPAWRDVAAFLLRLEGIEVEASSVEPVFDEPETVQPLTQALIRKAAVEAGMPLRTQLREEGWGEQRIEAMARDRAAERAGSASGEGRFPAATPLP